ncbi:MAG: hypothetical protein IT488_12620, partial [Gammaproteobacteria bacterium]|nr:hypothetical protein [Gammaproteobacteria bacterium]
SDPSAIYRPPKLRQTTTGNSASELKCRCYVNPLASTIPGAVHSYSGSSSNGRGLETSRTETYGTPQARTITTTWHSTLALPALITESGKTTAFTYDSNGLLTQKTITDTGTSTSRTWTYTYTGNGQLYTINGPRTDVSDITTFAYDSAGNISSITNALSQVTQITSYDDHGHPLTIVDPNGLTTTLTYDLRGRLTSRTTGGETTTYTYDNVGQLTRVTLPDDSYLDYTYDEAHRLTGIADRIGNYITYTLDAMGNRIQEDIYDPNDTLTQTRSRVYSTMNRLLEDLGADDQSTEYAYDNNGNLTSSTDPLSHTAGRTYDALNRITQVTDPNSGVTGFTYNARDQLTQVTDARSHSTTYTVDALDNLKQIVSPDTGTTTNTYDAAGNLLTSTDARGAVTTYTYDALNRITQVSATLSSTTVTSDFEYDSGTYGVGKLTEIEDDDSTTTYTYDIKGRVTSKAQTIGSVTLTTSYTYDSDGHLTQMTYPSGKVVGYDYDLQGRIAEIEVDSTTLLENVAYAPLGGAAGWTWGNSSSYSRLLDEDGRVASYTLGGTATNLTYDDASRITAVGSQSYGYDILDRLTSYSGVASQTYSYDATGNRTQFTEASNTDTYSIVSTNNRITSISGIHNRSYSYASNGNVTGDSTHTYTYDPRNRLTGVDGTTSYTLNGLGQRIKKTVSGTSTLYIYDEQGQLIGEYDNTGTAINETVYLDTQPVGILKSSAIYYVHTDHLNTPRAISDTSNTVIWRWDSDPFGTAAANEDPDTNSVAFTYNLRFPGQYYDQESGLNYNYFRDYDPVTGRYMQSDPIGLAGGINTYSYALSNPVIYADPTGEFVPAIIACAVNPACRALAIRAGAYALALWNTYDTANDARHAYTTVNNQCSTFDEKTTALGLLALGIFDPSPGNTAKSLGVNPFKGKTSKEVAEMLEKKGYVRKGPDPVVGRGTYVNPKTGRGYHINASHLYPKGPHVGVHRPRGMRDTFTPRDYPMEGP